MIPLRDRNPTHHLALVTLAVIALNAAVFFFVQPQAGTERVALPDGSIATIDASVRFTFEYAAVPCEITEGRSLDVSEVRETVQGADVCGDTADPPLFPGKNVWLAAVTSMFLHAGVVHIGSNMLFLWIFGNNIEDHVGPVRYTIFYLLAGLVALATHIALQPDSSVPIVGASGAVAGVMGAYLVWFPRAPVSTFVLLFLRDIPAGLLLVVWFGSQFFMGTDSSVAWAAHVGGFVFGAVVGALVRVVPAIRARVWRAPYDRVAPGRWDATGGIGRSVGRGIR